MINVCMCVFELGIEFTIFYCMLIYMFENAKDCCVCIDKNTFINTYELIYNTYTIRDALCVVGSVCLCAKDSI